MKNHFSLRNMSINLKIKLQKCNFKFNTLNAKVSFIRFNRSIEFQLNLKATYMFFFNRYLLSYFVLKITSANINIKMF